MFQALPLMQLRRNQAWLLYLAATGPFTLHKARGTTTVMREVELRQPRMNDHTGEIQDYNFLASLLPQDANIWYQR